MVDLLLLYKEIVKNDLIQKKDIELQHTNTMTHKKIKITL